MTTDFHPTRKAELTETGQIGMVVRDLEATIKRYVDDFGIGPWTIFEVGPENAPNLQHEGKPLEGRCRSAAAMVGSVMWELTQPLDDKGIFARFLREKGEGVHHIAVHTADYHGLVGEFEKRGDTFPLSGSFAGVDVAYLPTQESHGILLEVFSGMPGEAQDVIDSGKALDD
jgi:hypothetical protein